MLHQNLETELDLRFWDLIYGLFKPHRQW